MPSRGEELPQSMGAIGDSTTAGFLAKFERAGVHNFLYHYKILGGFMPFLFSTNKDKLSNPELSWSTGVTDRGQVRSHAFRILELNPNLTYLNVAIPGTHTIEVAPKELPALHAWSLRNTNQDFPDYVTLFIGANDICQDSVRDIPSPNEYERNIRKITQAILSSPNSHLLILPIPRFDTLRKNIAEADVFGALGFGIANKCKQVWRMAPICRTLMEDLSPLDQKRVYGHIKEYNQVLHRIVKESRAALGDRIRIATALESRELRPDDVSIDCFHPNFHMQNEVAETAWRYSWWRDRKLNR